MRVSPSAAEVGDGCGNQSQPGEGSQDKTTLVVSPLRLPAAFCEDIRDVAMLEIAQNAFHYAHPVGQHQGQPMAVANPMCGFFRRATSRAEGVDCPSGG